MGIQAATDSEQCGCFAVRGYVTGSTDTSLWTVYSKGIREYCGNVLPYGLVKYQNLSENIITPITKAADHDVHVTPDEIISLRLRPCSYLTSWEILSFTSDKGGNSTVLRWSRMQGSSSLKRKRQDGGPSSESLTDPERILYNIIRSRRDMAIWTQDMKRETNLPDSVVTKALKLLKAKNLIKEVVNIQFRGKKHYMAAEFEPSKEISGGNWYSDGDLDMEFIEFVKGFCLKYIFRQKVATLDGILEGCKKSGAFRDELTTQQIEDIVRALLLDNQIKEERSTGFEDYASVPVGRVCYKCTSKSGPMLETKTGAMASIPCGVCPRISSCTPEGIISPRTCVYYQKWLDF